MIAVGAFLGALMRRPALAGGKWGMDNSTGVATGRRSTIAGRRSESRTPR
jgi:hypothetical protein